MKIGHEENSDVIALISSTALAEVFTPIANSMKDGMCFVEVGVFIGGSFCFFGHETKKQNKNIKMHAVDTFEFGNISVQSVRYIENATGQKFTYERDKIQEQLKDLFISNVEKCGLTEQTLIHKSDSIRASNRFDDNSIDFIHFDGDHDIDYVRTEISAWLPKMKENSVIAGHDWPSVAGVIREFFEDIEVFNDESYVVKLGKGIDN